MCELTKLVETLALRDWKRVEEAERALAAAGQDGMQAVIAGMSDPNGRIRRACARYMDHGGDDLCIAPLTMCLLSDPVPKVRREAVHSLACDRCKDNPLGFDAVPLLLQVAQADPAKWVRYEALFGLAAKPPDPRIIAPLRALLPIESDPKVLDAIRFALKRHDPAFRAECAEEARRKQEGMRHKASPNTEHRRS